MNKNRRVQTTSAPRAPVAGVLLDPVQTADDIIDKTNEESPAFTLLASKCTTEGDFDQLKLKAFSFAWAIPHLVQTADDTFADDPRGAIVELYRSGISFRNISNQEITIHANTPVAKQHAPGQIYARLSGFHGKKGMMTDDVRLKPNQAVTFKTDWRRLPNEYTPIEEVINNRVWINIGVFAVEIKNVNDATGAPLADLASVVSMIPKVHYSKRRSNPVKKPGATYVVQEGANFAFQEMGGFDDMYCVAPLPARGGAKMDTRGRRVGGRPASEVALFADGDVDVSVIQDAVKEGDLLGVTKVLVTKGKEVYPCAGLVVKRLGGAARPLELSSRQGGGNRLLIMGLNIVNEPLLATSSYSSWKWDNSVGHWVLWNDDLQKAHRCPESLVTFTPVSSGIPVYFLQGVYTLKEKEEHMQQLLAVGKNEYGQPYGDPKGFGDFLRTAVSVITIVGQVAGFLGTLL